jgi:uncharacterized membrane protein
MKVLREILAALGVLFAILTAVYGCFTLPQRIPTHFNAANIADGWDDKSSLWFPVGIACVVYLVLTLIRFVLERYVNVPVGSEQRAATIPIGLEMVAWLKAEMTWIFAGTNWLTVALAQGHNPDLTMWFIFPVLAVVFATLIYYIARMIRLSATNTSAQEERG